MKNAQPIVTATSTQVDSSSASKSNEPVIRLKLDKPLHWDWELTTSADALPVIQLLDKDGRLLVETTGRTAQRARGSFRDGLKSREEFGSDVKDDGRNVTTASSSSASPAPVPLGNRNMDGFSSKFGLCEFVGYGPRKSRSEASVRERREKRGKKRHSTGLETSTRTNDEANEGAPSKRYSDGDYLRKQILSDLNSKSTVGKSSEEIARDRCRKVKAYLGSQSDSICTSTRTKESIETQMSTARENQERESSEVLPEDEGKKTKGRRQQPRQCSVTEADTIVSKSEESNSRANSTVGNEELERIRAFLREKIRRKMEQEFGKSACSTRVDSRDKSVTRIERRHTEHRETADDRGRYRARKVRSETNIVRFDPEVSRRDTLKEPHDESLGIDSICRKRRYRRSRSEIPMGSSTFARSQEQSSSRKTSSTIPEKRKLYRKTKSAALLSATGSSAENLPKNTCDFPRRIKSKDSAERIWREYEERKRHQRKPDEDVVEEEEDKKGRSKSENVLSDASSVDRPGTSLQENYILVDRKEHNVSSDSRNIRDLQESLSILNSPDFGYSSIPKSSLKDYRELYVRSNVKKSDTFKIVDGSEDLEKVGDSKEESSSCDFACSKGLGPLTNESNEDIARDYFKRVYELLKKRREEAQTTSEGRCMPGYDDSSSSNYVEEQHPRKHRRKKKEKEKGEEIVAVAPRGGGREAWKTQRSSVRSGESPSGRSRCCRPPLQRPAAPGGKRTRPSPNSRRNNDVEDISGYFDWPNKENTPGNAVNEEEPVTEARDERERTAMGSNLSRHNDKGLTGRRTQSSGNICEPKGKLNGMGKILVPCSSSHRERYKFCGSLPNHLDDKDVLDGDSRESNEGTPAGITRGFGGTLPHKKRLGVHFFEGPTGTLDLVKHRSQDSLDENDPWRYQDSDLDLVRCRRDNSDSTRRRNPSTDSMVDTGGRGTRGPSMEDGRQGDAELDLVGALPKRKQEIRGSGKSTETARSSSSSSSSRPCPPDATEQDDLLVRMIHKPNCELVKHRRRRFDECVDSKLASGEPQDQGYASERSPEDEHPPSLPGHPFPSVTPESTFRVTLQKSSRGLGLSVSGGGAAGPVRVKRLFPQQPAALSNKLQPGDILLAANGVPLTGLTNYEALEVLRTTLSTVELVVCRLPGDSNVTPPGAPPPPPARREPPSSLRLLNPLPPLQIEPCGEFDIEMTKVGGSLGFTLRKADSSALGHYVRALVREPAVSDGRIRPGDKIVAVDGAPLSPMSHEEAVALLRQCGPKVKLRLYRDLAQTPVSALSPTEPDHPLRPPRTSLRQEAVDMLCDLAVRKLSPGTSSGSSCKRSSGTSCNSPRRLRRLGTRTSTTGNDQDILEKVQEAQSIPDQTETSDSEQCSLRTQITNSQANTPATDIIDPPSLYDVDDVDDVGDICDVCDGADVCDASKSASRPSFLDLSAPHDKPRFRFCSLESECPDFPERVSVTSPEAPSNRIAEDRYEERANVPTVTSDERSDELDNELPSEPASMPPVLSSTGATGGAAFSYKNPAYQSANPACGTTGDAGTKSKTTHSSDQDIPGKILGADDPGGSKGLLKWKGVMFAPNDENKRSEEREEEQDCGKDTANSVIVSTDREDDEVFMVELTRGWNSRLGFSLQPEGDHTVISVVHPDSVAAKDGRLKQGDVLLMINDESMENVPTADIIDLLRKIRGSIGITVMRRKKKQEDTT